MRTERLPIETKIRLIEIALSQLQGREIPYIGLCVNTACGEDNEHPHWDEHTLKMLGL